MAPSNEARLRGLTPMLRTWKFDESIEFYREVLGFECANRAEGWAVLARDGIEIMLSAPNEHLDDVAPAFTGSLYLRTEGVDALWSQMRERARVCYPIEDFEYGMREFAIFDNNGYLLQFGQPLPESA